jgi:hypothetical protein
MSSLEDLLAVYPILESFVKGIPLSSILNLSRTSSKMRALLHGWSRPASEDFKIPSTNIRSTLHLGLHNSTFWLYLKGLADRDQCAEIGHKRGKNARGCRMCSLPVCEACIVKNSWGKKENTFSGRRRHLCFDCWSNGNPSTERLWVRGGEVAKINYERSPVCRCVARDGWLCVRCKEMQNQDVLEKILLCSGRGCDETIGPSNISRICLWCQLVLPEPRPVIDREAEYQPLYVRSDLHACLDAQFSNRPPLPPLLSDGKTAAYEPCQLYGSEEDPWERQRYRPPQTSTLPMYHEFIESLATPQSGPIAKASSPQSRNLTDIISDEESPPFMQDWLDGTSTIRQSSSESSLNTLVEQNCKGKGAVTERDTK